MATYNLTDAEFQVARHLIQACLDGMGGERPSDLENDEFTWIDLSDLTKHGYSKHAAAGFFSSLAAKGFITEHDANEWVVQTSAWRWMDDHWN